MKPLIIGVAGKANAGKDTVASMMIYHFVKGNIGSYADWLTHREKFENEQTMRRKYFADGLKLAITDMFNITIAQTNSRQHKDYMYYCLENGKFYHDNEVDGNVHEIITDVKLMYDHIADIISRTPKKKHFIRLRTLLQYFGTNICRNLIDYNIWTRNTMIKARQAAKFYDICFIPDVRFENEASAIMDDSLYGGLIKVNRDAVITSNHVSENINFKCEYEIDNNGTLMNLFYKTMELTQIIKDKYANN